MPELPEVETYRSRIAPAIEGQLVDRAIPLDPRIAAAPDGLANTRIEHLHRHGKWHPPHLRTGHGLPRHTTRRGSPLARRPHRPTRTDPLLPRLRQTRSALYPLPPRHLRRILLAGRATYYCPRCQH